MVAPTLPRPALTQAHRVVVKLGTALVSQEDGSFEGDVLDALMEDVAALHDGGLQIIVVSSGAVGLGARRLGMDARPESLGLRQACAAVGQGELMGRYQEMLAGRGKVAAQVLLAQEDLGDFDRALCLDTTLTRLLDHRVIPILNENDSVSVAELVEMRAGDGLVFGDNDALSARIALSLHADLLLLLTNVDGLRDGDPSTGQTQRIPTVDPNNPQLPPISGQTSFGGRGGMGSKVDAACLAAKGGVAVVIADGRQAGVVTSVLAGQDVGTYLPASGRSLGRHRRIASEQPTCGALTLNAGALQALRTDKASLLPVGVTSVEGSFARGDAVELRDRQGRVWGRGLVNYDAKDCAALAGHHSDAIEAVLGWRGYDALVTRDNLVLRRSDP